MFSQERAPISTHRVSLGGLEGGWFNPQRSPKPRVTGMHGGMEGGLQDRVNPATKKCQKGKVIFLLFVLGAPTGWSSPSGLFF